MTDALLQSAYDQYLALLAQNRPAVREELYDFMATQLWDTLPSGSSVRAWNDQPERTKEQVIAKLEEAGL